MISRIWTGSLLLLLGVVVVALVHACLYERGFHPYRTFWRKFRKLPWWKQVAVIFFVGILWVYAGEKPRGGNFMMSTLLGDPTPVTDEWTEFTPITSTNTTRTLEGDDFRRGFVFVRIDTNCPASIFNFQPSILNNQASSDWRAFGAASDWVYANVEWGIWNGEWGTGNGEWGTDEETRLRIYSDGWVEMQGSARSESAPYQDGDDGTGTPRTLKFFPFRAPLGIVPESNWHMVKCRIENGEWIADGGEPNSPFSILNSQFWHCVTPSNTLQLTWQNVLFGRDTNTPVSVRMEACPDGRFAYCYDLRNLKLRIENGELDAEELTNIVIGASIGSLPLQFTLADLVTNTPFSILHSPFSIHFHPLSPEDATDEDRDHDGLSLLDELFAFGSAPEHPDTDCDGVPDGAEVARGTDPGSRDTDADGFADGTDAHPLDVDTWTDANGDGLPDAWKDGWFGANATVAADADANADGISNLAALLMGVNPVAPYEEGFVFPYGAGVHGIRTWEIAPVAFEFTGRDSLTNLVSRTFAISRESPWEQYFVSSRPDRAEGWSMADVTLRYGLDGEPATNAVPVSPHDSWRIPLGEMMPQSISFRLDADGTAPFLSAPLYLLRWTPHIEFLPSASVTVIDGTNGHVYAAAKRNPDTGAYGVPFRFDATGIPCRHGVDPEIAADLARPPVDGVAVSNGMFTASDPLMADLPPEGTDLSKRLLFYDIDIGRTGAVSSGPRASPYASPYPLTSSSLRKAFHAATGVTADGTVTLTLSPDVPELGFTTGTSFLRGGLRSPGTTSGGSRSETVMPPASVTPTICGEPCTNDTLKIGYELPEDHDETPAEDDEDDGEHGEECGCCEDGGSSLGSFRIRIPFGESAKDERLGYLWTVMEGPTAVTPSVFGVLAAQGVSVATNANGSLSISCSAVGGKSLTVTNIAYGVAVSVWNSSGRFESRWEVYNEDGDTSCIRVRRVTVLGNATVDETYATWTEEEPVVFEEMHSPATVWVRSDNIRGVTKKRYEWRDGIEHDFISEEYDETWLAGNLVRAEQRTYAKIGEGSVARRRLSRTCGYDERGWYETVRTYWCDTDHPDRHARLKSMCSDLQPWAWYDYDSSGRETVRIEQLDGSPFPELADVSPYASLPQGCSAKITATDYAPRSGDFAHRNDSFEPREVSVYVRHGASSPILVSHETRIYTRETDAAGNPLRRIVKNVGLGGTVRTETTVEYPQDSIVPSHLRGLPIFETAPDGTVTTTEYALSNGCLVATVRRYPFSVPASPFPIPQSPFPTYTVTISDAAYRLPLREETRLTSGGALLEWSERTYDDIRRLRSVSYSDGTSETNAYSCCRLLWRRDRQGRKVLRSAQTGSDSLYYANEDVWLGDVSADGTYRIVQHHFDGFGRPTETLTHLGSTPGEATAAYAPTAEQQPSERRVEYLDEDMNGSTESTDERGKVTWGNSWRQAFGEQMGESVYRDEEWSDYVSTSTTRYRNGGMAVESWWNGGGRQESTTVGYDANGRRVETVWVSASDHAAVTNAVKATDALGRLAYAWTPGGTTEFAYDGTSSRVLRMEFSTGQVERTSYMIHNQVGEQVGTVLDGVTNRTDVTYEQMSNAWWRVTTELTIGPNTNSVSVVKEQMTELGGVLRGRRVSVDATGLETFTELTFNADTQIETETEARSDGTWKTIRRKHGLVLETETAAGRMVNTYDGFGRVISVERTLGADANLQPVSRTEYTPWGDVVAVETYTNGTDVVRESYGYDMFGNRTAVTNALGEVVESDFDVLGNVVAMRGATYPVEMEYDTENRRTALRTTRDGVAWDETRWTYDVATGSCTSKTYADNSQVHYTYTPDNLPLRTTYASGKWKENVYDNQRRLAGMLYSSPGMDYEIQKDAYGNVTNVLDAAGNIWRYSYGYNSKLLGEMFVQSDGVTVAQDGPYFVAATNCISRAYDQFSRPSGFAFSVNGEAKGDIGYAYDADGRISRITTTNSAGRSFTVAYTNVAGYNCGYTITLPSGSMVRRAVERDDYRRNLVTNCSTYFNSSLVDFSLYAFDALSRPMARTTSRTGCQPVQSAFIYNDRSEVVSAAIGTNIFSHAYDSIGNHVLFSDNLTTNTFSHNQVNQMVGRVVLNAPLTAFTYTPDGGLSSDGDWDYAYDAEDQLVSVTSASLTNGAVRVFNSYDYRRRRISKTVQRLSVTSLPPPAPPIETYEWNTIEYRTFAYDGWNLIHETVATIDGGTTNVSEVQYFWGLDLSGSLQGAGGVGGLLAVSSNGQFYFPTFDNNGNVTKYIDESGNIVAAYEYDDFGRIISQSGTLADQFRISYSTKYHDSETGLYYYGYRYYSPMLMRWLDRDPIGEDGGLNVYGFCGNNPIVKFDLFGMKVRSAVSSSKCASADIDAAAKKVLSVAVGLMNKGDPRLEYYGNLCCACKKGKYRVIVTGPVSGTIKIDNSRYGAGSYSQELPVSYPDDHRIQCPPGSRRVGYYHTHVLGTNFSKDDLEVLQSRDHPYYMSQDGKRVLKAIPRRTDNPIEAGFPPNVVVVGGIPVEPVVVILE